MLRPDLEHSKISPALYPGLLGELERLKQDGFPTVRIGKYIRVNPSVLEQWVTRQTR